MSERSEEWVARCRPVGVLACGVCGGMVNGTGRAWEREATAQIRAVVGTTPVLAVHLDRGVPACGALDAAELAAGRLRPARVAPLTAGRLPCADASQQAILVSFVGTSTSGGPRRRLLAEIRRALAPGGCALVVDHNRPRGRLAALCALIAAPVPPGASPGARWRRLAYTTAREAQAAGLAVVSLGLASGERVQLVVARVDEGAGPAPPAGEDV